MRLWWTFSIGIWQADGDAVKIERFVIWGLLVLFAQSVKRHWRLEVMTRTCSRIVIWTLLVIGCRMLDRIKL